MPEPTKGPNCFECTHLTITHDRRRPYRCSLMGFKSRGLPAYDVLRIQGHGCLAFCLKKRPSR
ncbi:MAG TPA: uracil-DNA glycosylase [Porticoccaceae bacterium]|nr:uracil-DNA glycosylase [Porticoccaceae bacterium]HIK79916.1 uracil-DNA glycosylase [Porticoccaceae bacterium]